MTQDTRNLISWATGLVMGVAIVLLGLKVERIDQQLKHELQTTAVICTTGADEIA